MLSKAQLTEQVADAYEHLYDLVSLRTHPLADALIGDPAARRKEIAWHLHHLLLDVIEEIDPGPHAPAFSREWRRHRLMVLHYVDGLDPQAVADELGISRRHYYREHETAIEAVASILWQRHVAEPAPALPVSPAVEEQASLNRLELLRLEAARTAQGDRYIQVQEVIQGVQSLLQESLRQRELELRLDLADVLPAAFIDQSLLRQVLLGVLGYLIEFTSRATIGLTVYLEKSMVRLSLTVDPPTGVDPAFQAEVEERLAAFREMTLVSGSTLLPIRAGREVVGFTLQAPTSSQRTVLVVDDNEDVLELFQRYLTPHDYQVVTAQTAAEAIPLARQMNPYAITLDLMMPGQDGWDLMQTLLNQPDTSHIPLIVCSVLRQKELALMLGATAFLEKPVSEQDLLAALDALTEA